jgi:nicotinate-nucleotide adenylyltransferase
MATPPNRQIDNRQSPTDNRHVPSPLALLGGTFDPPHIGHLVLAECARAQFDATRVVFLPAGDPYRKRARIVSPGEHRLAMTRLAVASNPAFSVDDREMRRSGPTYTVDTLEELHAEGTTNVILILGSDAVADMAHWKRPERIRELATIAVAAKPGATLRPEDAEAVIAMPPLAISSSLIRARVALGEPVRYLAPDAVREYIEQHGLYR